MSKKIKARSGKCISMGIILFMLITCFSFIAAPIPVNASANLYVNFSNVIQSYFLGSNAIYQGFAYMSEQEAQGMNDMYRDIEFARIANMNLHIARTWYRPDWNVTSIYNWENCIYNWNTEKMQEFCDWLQAMKDRNVDVALNLGWWFPGDLHFYYDSLSRPLVWPDDAARFSQWVSESLNYLINVRGFTNIKYGMLFTEPNWAQPDTPILDPNKTVENNQFDAYVYTVNAIKNKLVADGRRNLLQLVGPNFCRFDNNVMDISPAVLYLNDCIDIYSCHSYGGTYTDWYNRAASLQNQVASTGKPFWIDEGGLMNLDYRRSADYGNYLAQLIAGLINAGAQTFLLWELFDTHYVSPVDGYTAPGDAGDCWVDGQHQWGTAPWLPDNQTPYPSFYAYSLLSKYLGGGLGTQAYGTTNSNGVYISAISQPGGDYSFLVVNSNEAQQDISVSLSGSIGKKLYRYLYDPATITPDASSTIPCYDKVYNSVSTSFSDTIPSRAVAIYSSIQPSFVSNPDFENGTTGWTNWQSGTGCTFTRDNTGHNSSYSVKIHNNSVNDNGCWIQPFYAAAPAGKQYKFSAYMKTSNVAADGFVNGAYISAKCRDTNGIVIGDFKGPIVTGTNDWAQYDMYFTPPEGTDTIQLTGMLYGGSGDVWLDDFRLDLSAAAFAEKISNNNIETGSPANWQSWTDSSSVFTWATDQYYSSNHSLKISNSSASYNGCYSQCLTSGFSTSHQYRLKAKVKLSNVSATGLGASVSIECKNSAGVQVKQAFTCASGTTNGWIDLSCELTPTADTASLWATVKLYGASGTAWFDDISFVEEP